MEPATGLVARGQERVILLGNEDEVRARAVVIAAGASYRRLGIPSLDRLIGAGVFYRATGSQARAAAAQGRFSSRTGSRGDLDRPRVHRAHTATTGS